MRAKDCIVYLAVMVSARRTGTPISEIPVMI
jgi:hypothetical protein